MVDLPNMHVMVHPFQQMVMADYGCVAITRIRILSNGCAGTACAITPWPRSNGTAAVAGTTALSGKAYANLGGREGTDLPGERAAAVGSDGHVSMRVPQGWRAIDVVFYEMSANDPDFPEIYGLLDSLPTDDGDRDRYVPQARFSLGCGNRYFFQGEFLIDQAVARQTVGE